MKLSQVLFTQGFGTRRECAALIGAGLVAVDGQPCDDPDRDLATEGLVFTVRGEPWVFHERAVIALNKPTGYECSQKPKHHASVYSLLPAPLRQRDAQSIGRLDEDTTGVLLFTDDGTMLHRLTSPKHHVAKVYEVSCKHPVDEAQRSRLLEGVLLHDDNETVRAAACEVTGELALRLTLTEGKYHQVKRMVAAAGNRVEALHRSDFGGVGVEGLAPGAWRWLDDAEIDALTARRAPGGGVAA